MSDIETHPISDGIKFWNKSCSQLILDKAAERPDKVALIDASTGATMTFLEMVTAVKRVASALSMHGLRRGDVVCMSSMNNLQVIVMILAISRAGGVLTAMNPLFTTDEMITQIADSSCVYMVTTPNMVQKVDKVKTKYKGLKEVFVLVPTPGYVSYDDLLSEGREGDPDMSEGPDKLAMILYSSGTTGKPKGVMLTHRCITTAAQFIAHPEVDAYSEDKSFLAIFPMYHIGGITLNLFAPLYTLSTVVMMPVFSFKLLLEALQKYKIQCMFAPPPILVLLAKRPEVSQYDLSHLHTMTVGAAPVAEQLVHELKRKIKVTIRQLYGLTESGGITHLTPKGVDNPTSCGSSLPSNVCKIVNPVDGNTMNYMEQGEVFTRGPAVMKGYLNRPDATATTLTSDGWISTGDLGYISKDGLLYIIDRQKELIKYKGYQVAPAELEAVLLKHPDVADAAVIGVLDELAGELPRGYIVLKQGQNTRPVDIANFVKERVAPYKRLRGGVCLVDTIPKSPSGKILRRFLRDMARSEQLSKSKL